MTTLADFVGLPFADHGRGDGHDCYGGVRAVLAACAGLHLPDYGDTYADCGDHDGIASGIRAGLAIGWQRVSDPRRFDVVVFNITGQPRHIGVMVGPSKFLHWPEKGTSRIERLDDRMWHKRIEGVYRYVG
jgi:cell wall-associated NlpC family hydrolase